MWNMTFLCVKAGKLQGRAFYRVLPVFLCCAFSILVFLPHGARATTGFDDFNRSNGALGANWELNYTYTGAHAAVIVSNGVGLANSGDTAVMDWIGSGVSSNDQFSQMTMVRVPIVSNDFWFVDVRQGTPNATGTRGYFAGIRPNEGDLNYRLWRYDSPGGGFLLAASTQAAALNDVVRLEVHGTHLTLFVNGISLLTATDSTYTTGRPGFEIVASTNAVPCMDNWSGGDFSGVQVSSRSDTLSNSLPSATSNHTVAFTINNSLDTVGSTATDTLAIEFPSDFDLTNIFCKDVDISFGGTATSIAGYFGNRATSQDCPGSATSWGLFISTSTNAITFYTPTSVATYVATGTPVQITIGSNATFQDTGSAWITNSSSARVYTISVGGTFGGSGNILVSINSAVSVQVAVAESLAFTVSSVKAVNCTADDGATVSAVDTSPTSVPLGTLFPVNTFFTGCQDLVVSTNAGNGYSVTVQEQTLMHTLGGFTFPQTTCDGAACTLTTAAAWTNPANNGFGHTCFNQDGNHDCASTYSSGTKFRPTANVAAGDAAETVMSSSTPATVTARIKYRISAGIQQAAGTYTTVIVYTVTPTY